MSSQTVSRQKVTRAHDGRERRPHLATESDGTDGNTPVMSPPKGLTDRRKVEVAIGWFSIIYGTV
jgi:hypothetical protein